MDEEPEVFCLKVATGRTYNLNEPNGRNFVFAFLDKSRCEQFLEQIKLYLPNLTMSLLQIKKLVDLKRFSINELIYVYLNPVIQIGINNETPEITYTLTFKEEYNSSAVRG